MNFCKRIRCKIQLARARGYISFFVQQFLLTRAEILPRSASCYPRLPRLSASRFVYCISVAVFFRWSVCILYTLSLFFFRQSVCIVYLLLFFSAGRFVLYIYWCRCFFRQSVCILYICCCFFRWSVYLLPFFPLVGLYCISVAVFFRWSVCTVAVFSAGRFVLYICCRFFRWSVCTVAVFSASRFVYCISVAVFPASRFVLLLFFLLDMAAPRRSARIAVS